MVDYKLIGEMLDVNPLSLLTLYKDKQVAEYLNNLVPYSVGFEIECDQQPHYDAARFRAIPAIMDVNVDPFEQRYRIPNGLRGIICLYHISYQLKQNSLLNPKSSIHYQIDCTDCNWGDIGVFLSEEKNYILKELDTWLIREDGKKEDADSRDSGSWYRYNSRHRTIEFRLGEMTFDYKLMLKRIIHCCKIVKKFKDTKNIPKPVFEPPSFEANKTYIMIRGNSAHVRTFDKELKQLQEELKALEATPVVPTEQIEFRRRRHIIE